MTTMDASATTMEVNGMAMLTAASAMVPTPRPTKMPSTTTYKKFVSMAATLGPT
ncbi:MAG: hypothetical protein GXY32_07955 [Ruminococcaceae bacterium]|nr:hypothetical protein [Oscillospiraceae bacterium]